jgi:hypothetical protein
VRNTATTGKPLCASTFCTAQGWAFSPMLKNQPILILMLGAQDVSAQESNLASLVYSTVTARATFKLVCGACYEEIKTKNMLGPEHSA